MYIYLFYVVILIPFLPDSPLWFRIITLTISYYDCVTYACNYVSVSPPKARLHSDLAYVGVQFDYWIMVGCRCQSNVDVIT
jgi:hypothetical protein